ncbi:MAG: hypothetical protein VX760_01095 [Actinomycetota bacterium]|nr:hypothetical protein [Actinomycetota bacterium]
MGSNLQTIETPLLIVGCGPAALVIAKVVSGRGLPCLIVGHEAQNGAPPVTLDSESLEILEPHGVLSVLRPYAVAQNPFTITPLAFENGLKHHCVADMLITVYDDMRFKEATQSEGGIRGELTDGSSTWEIHADAFADVSDFSVDLNHAVHQAAAFGNQLMANIT